MLSFNVKYASLANFILQVDHWSWKDMEFRKAISRPGKSWKITKVMESHGK